MQIAALLADNPYVLAPLAGYTDLAFRLLCREMGAALCFTEMISCHGLTYGQKNTLVLLKSNDRDRPLGVQLFGSDPKAMAQAASLISGEQADFIDINMGCPVRKVTRKGAGAALMKNLELAELIIRQVVAHSTLPVTVKFRSGWNSASINAPQFAQMAEKSGAAAVTVHARTWSQAFTGNADHQIIAQVTDSVSIPVIGNGDILSYRDGKQLLLDTGCTGVMIGRGTLGNPWVFSPQGRPETLSARLPVIQRHLELAEELLQVDKMLFRIKNHIGRYLSGLAGASRIRQEITRCATFADLKQYFQEIKNLTVNFDGLVKSRNMLKDG
ncbi:MAG TPA: tRNA dihydrouridine synthase DusB [Desulfobulbaceae bacterium]|nr:tRNA dihydrouridine synthase DusB [Desulfobulbaceae bacterium]